MPRPYWLIVGRERAPNRALTIGLSAHTDAVAVFSFEDEARMYLHLRTEDPEQWRVRETSAGELISVLCGPCAGTKRVVLDPVPEPGGMALAGLLSVDRDDFMQTLLLGGSPSLVQPAWPRDELPLESVSGVA